MGIRWEEGAWEDEGMDGTVTTEMGSIEGDVEVTEPYTLLGAIRGSVVVKAGGTLTMIGKVAGDATIEHGARAEIAGSVGGDAVNLGGDLAIAGLVEGDLDARAGRTILHDKAKVRGEISGEVRVVSEEEYSRR
jgi:cytoskeletal protein CcmA (bactofilin family)